MSYSGHGSLDVWNGAILTSSDAANLTNRENLAIFVMMTCLNGYFQDPLADGLAEALVKAERGGAVAAWASSGISAPGEQAVMNRELFRLMFNRGDGTALTIDRKSVV